MLLRLLPLPLLLCLSFPLAAPAADHDAVRRAVQAGKLKPLAEILASVQASHPGRVLDVDLERDASGRQWYEIKLLNRDGQRIEIYVDAVTGKEASQQKLPATSIKPMTDVLRSLLAAQPGTVLHAELEDMRDGRHLYDITLELTDGRQQRFMVDAVSGQMLSTDPRKPPTRGRFKPLPELIEPLEQRYRGRAVEVEIKYDAKGQPYYEIELQLPNGRELEVNVDPVTGQVIREEGLN